MGGRFHQRTQYFRDGSNVSDPGEPPRAPGASAIDAGMADHITKPVTPELLRQALEQRSPYRLLPQP